MKVAFHFNDGKVMKVTNFGDLPRNYDFNGDFFDFLKFLKENDKNIDFKSPGNTYHRTGKDLVSVEIIL